METRTGLGMCRTAAEGVDVRGVEEDGRLTSQVAGILYTEVVGFTVVRPGSSGEDQEDEGDCVPEAEELCDCC